MFEAWQPTIELFRTYGAAGREVGDDGSWSVTASAAPSRGALLEHVPGTFRTVIEGHLEEDEHGGAVSFGVDVCASASAVVLWRDTDGHGVDLTLSVYPNVDALIDGVLSARAWFDEEEAAQSEAVE